MIAQERLFVTIKPRMGNAFYVECFHLFGCQDLEIFFRFKVRGLKTQVVPCCFADNGSESRLWAILVMGGGGSLNRGAIQVVGNFVNYFVT